MLDIRKMLLLTAVFLGILTTWSTTQAQNRSTAPMSLSREESVWISVHDTVRVGVWLGHPPVMFRGKRGRFQGMIPAYIDTTFTKIGIQPRFVHASSFAALWELMRAGEVDVIAAVTPSPERNDVVDTSTTYLSFPIVILTHQNHSIIAGLDDLAGKIVAVESGHVPHLRLPKDYPQIRLLEVANPTEGISAVRGGRAEAYLVAEEIISYLSSNTDIHDLRVASLTEYTYQVSFGIRKDWPILTRLVNRALSSMSDEERQYIKNYWTVIHDSGWLKQPQMWRIIGGIVLSAGILLIFVITWNRKLSKEISLRNTIQKELQKTLKVHNNMIESSNAIILGLSFSGHVIFLNAAGEKATGYSRDELLGQDWFDIVVPRDRYPYVWETFSRPHNAKQSAFPTNFENQIVTKDGEVRIIQWSNSVTPTQEGELEYICFGTDVTNRRNAEEELRLTQFVMDNAAVGVFRFKPSGHIMYANMAAATALGYSRSELQKMTIFDINPQIQQEQWPELWSQLKNEQMIMAETTIVAKDGTELPVEVTAYALSFKGVELAIGFFADISERQRIATLREDVERMMRHDLRSPTMAVQTLYALLHKADNLTESQRELLESVMRSGRRMLNIIDMSRALFKMEEGSYAINPEPVDMLALANEVAQDLDQALTRKGILIRILCNNQPPTNKQVFLIQSEPLLCYALLSNLIKNAVEASPENGEVTVDMECEDTCDFTIHNEGVIPDSIQKNFFDKYVTEGKSYGTGLGTYTAKLIATTLGGSIHFTTSHAAGTTLTVLIQK